ncbi:MAG: hypothetical protein KatS3mg014_2183 [Actinomycetota bacterium]|nr:MAG: hypothetical protein KatS3mg014_2183 [Actinomycetota bacterium]
MKDRTRRVGRRLATLLVIGALVLAPAAFDRAPAPQAAEARHHLVLRGRAHGLFPGGTRPMRVVIGNRTDREVRLVRLGRRVVQAPPGCPTKVLRVRHPRALPVLPAGGRARIRLRVRLLRSAPDACQGAVFVVRFRARGVAA